MTTDLDGRCDPEVPENRAGALQVGVEYRVLDHEGEPPRLRQSVARYVQSLVTFVTSGRRLRPGFAAGTDPADQTVRLSNLRIASGSTP